MSDIVTSSRTETITVSAGLCSARRLAVPRQTFAPRTVSPTHSSRLLRALRLSKSTNVNMDFPGAPSVKTLAREETAHYIWRRRFDVRIAVRASAAARLPTQHCLRRIHALPDI